MGIKDFASGISFGALHLKDPETISIEFVDVYYASKGMQNIKLGSGEGTEFDSSYHQFEMVAGAMLFFASGIYLLSYNITTTGASNDNLSVGFSINGAVTPIAVQQVYSRAGDQFETGSSVLQFLKAGDLVTLAVANTSDTSNITLPNANVSATRLKYSGRLNKSI